MPGLWVFDDKIIGGKFLVLRRDGSKPKWPYIVLGAADPAAPAGLLAYADRCEELGYDPEYVEDVRHGLTGAFESYRAMNDSQDPTSPPDREDDPEIIEKMMG
ncbi:MAG: hypothetical protein GY719_26225 [bacterium]|nr:hypothetical protein [bacterium]